MVYGDALHKPLDSSRLVVAASKVPRLALRPVHLSQQQLTVMATDKVFSQELDCNWMSLQTLCVYLICTTYECQAQLHCSLWYGNACHLFGEQPDADSLLLTLVSALCLCLLSRLHATESLSGKLACVKVDVSLRQTCQVVSDQLCGYLQSLSLCGTAKLRNSHS